MPLGTLDRTPPPFFKQGPSALSKLMVCSALALFLMVADARFKITQPLRAGVATALHPVQWLALQPVLLVGWAADYFEALSSAQRREAEARRQLAEQSLKANRVEQLAQENEQLRRLLDLRQRTVQPSQAAEVLYEAADPYTRKIIIDKGQTHGIDPGSPVIDEAGVLGQVTRAHPLISEVTLVTDRDQAIPVLNTRTGMRGVAYGEPGSHGSALELRYMAANADVKAGDMLTTSGVDAVYPPGLPVAQVVQVERRADSTFARILAKPAARVDAARHVMVLKPLGTLLPARPAQAASAPAAAPAGARK